MTLRTLALDTSLMTAASPTADLDRLWSDYKSTPQDRHLRDQLIVHYAPLVKYVAGRVASGLPQSVDQADLVSYGIIGLIDAIEKFDLGRGFKFETYAIARIRGAMLDELRAIDWVPRSVRAKARQIEQAFASLEAKLHRAPTDVELAEQLDCTEAELQTMLGQISFTGLVALDELMGGSDRGEGMTLGDTITDGAPGPLAAYEVTEVKERLADAIRSLPEREKIVVGLYYYEGLTLAEIGNVLGVTESRVCQLHTKAVLHLRVRVGNLGRDTPDD
jgi:RNA polymerase sigma factor for flagellar operon FliA